MKINIEDYLSSVKWTTRKELCEKTGLGDRTVRNEISKLKRRRVVIYNTARAGYRLAREYKSMSRIERDEEIAQIKHSLNDKKSREKVLRKQMRKDIAYLKKAEQIEEMEKIS